MKRNVSIKSKLLLLLLATITLPLLLAGTALGYLIERYYEAEAEEGFARVFHELSVQLLQQEQGLARLAQRLSQRDDLIASINMISRYATPEEYLPLVYDGEKQLLARSFRNESQSTTIDEIAAYDAQGTLISFYTSQDNGVMGYLTFADGEPVVMASGNGRFSQWQSNSLPEGLARTLSPSQEGDPVVLYRQSAEILLAEFRSPIYRSFPDGVQIKVGDIVVRKYIDKAFINGISEKTGIRTQLITDLGRRSDQLPEIGLDALANIATTDKVSEQLPLTRFNMNESFAAGMLLVLADDSRALFLSVVPREVVSEAVNETFSMVLLVLLLSAAVILPLGISVSQRTISRPIARLSEAVSAVERGEYGARVDLRSNDELSALAHAFNSMSTSIHQRERELVESEDKYRNLVDNLPQRVFLKDRHSTYISCNRSYAHDLGIEPEDIVGKSDFELFAPEYAREYRLNDEQVMLKGEIAEIEEPYIIGGRESVVLAVKTPIRNADNEVVGILGIFWDITDKKLAEEKLRQSAVVFESTADGVMVTDAENRIIAVNKAFCDITGYSQAEALGKSPSFRRSERQGTEFYSAMWDEIAQTGRWQGEIWNRRKNGEIYPEWMTVNVVRDEEGRIGNYVAVFSDITQVKHSQMQLDHMAHHDPLTDLPNRNLLADRLAQAVHRAERTGNHVAVLFIDLDRFKNVNDTLGHPSGDLLLQDVARRLQHMLRLEDTVARLGGDEFIVVVEDIERPDFAESVASKIIDVIAAPFTINGQELFIGASIGISLYPTDGNNPSNLIKYADTAMYQAKEKGRNTYQFYTQELTDTVMERLALESSLRRALEAGQLELHYQPQVELGSGRIVGAEVLLRWYHPEHGMISPERFIPLAEEAGLILPIGEWVLEQACIQAAQWCELYPEFERIAVNLSIAQLQRSDFVEKVRDILQRTGLSAEKLELEITEGMLMQFPDITRVVLNGLRDLGVDLAIDDFGTGYSSLGYLKRFPIQILKIDRSFIMDIPADSNDVAITRAVIALGKSLQLKVIAEGVETVQQAEFLLQEGCNLGQGYYYNHPVSAEELLRLLQLGRLPEQNAVMV
ncbi:MAG TPA: EAL domain-containing protein [Gammaproteobacteria bacterium]